MPSTREPDPDHTGGGIAAANQQPRPSAERGFAFMQVVVFANGTISDTERARAAAQAADLVIAADGGARHCLALGVTPGVVIGDLDSLTSEEMDQLAASGAELMRVPAAKDETDLELALHQAQQRGAQKIVVLGGTGGRLDMTAANLLLLADPALDSTQIELWHGHQTAMVLTPPGSAVPGEPGDTLSLIPLDSAAQGVTSQDLEFKLEDEALAFGPARGVSNRIRGPRPSVGLRAGKLLVVHTPAESELEKYRGSD